MSESDRIAAESELARLQAENEEHRKQESQNQIRIMPEMHEHEGLSKAVHDLWESVYELGDDPVISKDPTVKIDSFCGSSAEGTAKIIDEYVDVKAVHVYHEDDMQEAAQQIRDAIASIPGAKAYGAGDSGDDLIIVITKDPDDLARSLVNEQAVWVHGLPNQVKESYKDLVLEDRQPEEDGERVALEVHES